MPDRDDFHTLCHQERRGVQAEVERLHTMLAACYRATRADPDGNEDWRLAEHAYQAVLRLRVEADELGEALDDCRNDGLTHAGHPWSATRWCVNDVCNRQALARQAIERDDDPTDIFVKEQR